jgi:hypothetical protein
MKLFILFILLSLSSYTFALNVGFNQAWFHNDYGQQYLDHKFDEHEVERIFSLARSAGSTTVRLWLFESSDFPMLNWNNDELLGVKPEFIKNFTQTLRLAEKHQIKIYMTIFDAHAYAPGKKFLKIRQFFNPKGTERFLKLVMQPLMQAIKDNQLLHTIEKLDVINEGDTVVNRFGFNLGWSGVKKMLCTWKSAIPELAITMSVRNHALLRLPHNLFDANGPFACADFYDFHSYSDEGKIYNCRGLKKYAVQNLKPMVLGEFGQSFFNHAYDNDMQVTNTKNYIEQAQSCGFKEALAWRLSDIRPGHNKEARYSFEAFGTTRPAFDIIRLHNLSLK